MVGKYLIAGIHTGIGKTMVSCALIKAFGFDYWKPFQTGALEDDDTRWIQNQLKNQPNASRFYEPFLRFDEPVSPHIPITKFEINPLGLDIPDSENLIIESAGGLLTPLDEKTTFLDFAVHYDLQIILVIGHYLGSINHSLATLNCLRNSQAKFSGIVYSGNASFESERIINAMFSPKILGKVPFCEDFDQIQFIKNE